VICIAGPPCVQPFPWLPLVLSHVFRVECSRVGASQLFGHRAVVPKVFAALSGFAGDCGRLEYLGTPQKVFLDVPGQPGRLRMHPRFTSYSICNHPSNSMLEQLPATLSVCLACLAAQA
jgi:hypothetical protein